MVFSRGTRAPRCDRCGRILAPYNTCRLCSIPPASAEAKPAAAGSLEALIAEALPDTFEAPPAAFDAPAEVVPDRVPAFVAAAAGPPVFIAPPPTAPPPAYMAPAVARSAPLLAPTVGSIDDILSPVAPGAATSVAVDDRQPQPEPMAVSTGFYDPEDFAIPRDPDLFLGGGGGHRRFKRG